MAMTNKSKFILLILGFSMGMMQGAAAPRSDSDSKRQREETLATLREPLLIGHPRDLNTHEVEVKVEAEPSLPVPRYSVTSGRQKNSSWLERFNHPIIINMTGENVTIRLNDFMVTHLSTMFVGYYPAIDTFDYSLENGHQLPETFNVPNRLVQQATHLSWYDKATRKAYRGKDLGELGSWNVARNNFYSHSSSPKSFSLMENGNEGENHRLKLGWIYYINKKN